jgi:Domain of unknown function (DUF4375)
MNRNFAAFALAILLTTSAMAQTPPLPPLPPEVMRMAEEFNNRKKYSEFDLKTIQSIKDEHLEQALLDYVFAKLDEHPGERLQLIASLSPGFQVFYSTWLVEAEVMNGGFNQYFWNSSSEFADMTPSALKEIGDTVAAEMMQKAIATANAEAAQTKKFKSIATLQAFSDSYKHTKLNDFDQPFSKRAELFPALRLRYVRQHEQSFVTR